MQFDQRKLERQKICFENVLIRYANPVVRDVAGISTNIRAAIIMAATGFGKTFILIMIILDMNERKPDRNTIIIVPTTRLKDDWIREQAVFDEKGKLIHDVGHIKKHNLQNVRVFVVNTYVKYSQWECDFLGLDEAHHYATIDSKYFSTVLKITKYKFGLALSATLTAEQLEYYQTFGWLLADTVTEKEAEKNGYITKSTVYNLGIQLSEDGQKFNNDINAKFKSYFARFNFDLELLKACNTGDKKLICAKVKGASPITRTGLQWREDLARKKGWKGNADHPFSPSNIVKYASQAMLAMSRRKKMLHNHPDKVTAVEELVKKFGTLKTIIYCETAAMADVIKERLGKTAAAYHTELKTFAYKEGEFVYEPTREMSRQLRQEGWVIKGLTVQKREALALFHSPGSGVNQLVTVRALDEGYDNDKVKFLIYVAYNSTKRQRVQRDGRGKRIDYVDLAKNTLIVRLYIMGSQEVRWLEDSQDDSAQVIYVESVEDIKLYQPVDLYGTTEEPVPAAETGNLDFSDSSGGAAPF